MSNPNTLSFTNEDIIRIRQLLKDGVTVQREVEDLRGGLNETIKAIAEEIEIKPAQLKRAIRIAYKDSLDDERESFGEVEYILEVFNKT